MRSLAVSRVIRMYPTNPSGPALEFPCTIICLLPQPFLHERDSDIIFFLKGGGHLNR